jgi:hypothetical protein
MKQLRIILAALASFALAIPLVALTSAASVDIPFDFQANGKNFTAGKYRLEPSSTAGSVIVLRNEQGEACFMTTIPIGNPNRAETPRMEFRKTAGDHILASVYMPGGTGGRGVHTKKLPSGERVALALAR